MKRVTEYKRWKKAWEPLKKLSLETYLDIYFEKLWNETEQRNYIVTSIEGGVKTDWDFGKGKDNAL